MYQTNQSLPTHEFEVRLHIETGYKQEEEDGKQKITRFVHYQTINRHKYVPAFYRLSQRGLEDNHHCS